MRLMIIMPIHTETSGQSLLAHSLGSYQNYADCGEATTQVRLENYFGKNNFERLKDLKYKYAPTRMAY